MRLAAWTSSPISQTAKPTPDASHVGVGGEGLGDGGTRDLGLNCVTRTIIGHRSFLRPTRLRASRPLSARLLVAPADVHHPVPDRRFGVPGLRAFLGLAALFGLDAGRVRGFGLLPLGLRLAY